MTEEKDIAPALLETIEKAFYENLARDRKGAELLKKIHIKHATYETAGDYAEQIGIALAKAFRDNLSSDVLPDGKMYWNIADRVVRPLIGADYRLTSEAAALVQQALNEAAGIGLKAKAAPLNEERVSGFLNTLANAERYDDVAYMLEEPVLVNFTRSIVDETVKVNADFHRSAGLHPKIVRRAEHKACKWCRALAGSYNYPEDTPDDVFRRHENCRCVVEYDPGDGSRQDVWTKEWTDPQERGKLEARKTIALENTTPQSKVVSNALKSGTVKDSVNYQLQAKHCKEDPGYVEGRSYLYGSVSDAERLYNELKGTGEPLFASNGEWKNKERVSADRPIGVHIDMAGVETETNSAMIVYSKSGSHIYPRKAE